MSSNIVKILIGVCLVAFVLLGAYLIIGFVNRPLAEPIVVNTATAPAKSLPSATVVSAQESAPQGTCGNTGAQMVLFIGTGVYGDVDNADAVRYLKVDYDIKRITIVAIPRDLWLDSGDPAIGQNFLGNLYYSKKALTNGSEKHKNTTATSFLAQLIYQNFELAPNNYFTVDIIPWGDMIQSIGGVTVDLAAEFTTTDGTILPPGPQHLSGSQSMDYVRMFIEGGDQARIDRQNRFVAGLRDRLLSFDVIPEGSRPLQTVRQGHRHRPEPQAAGRPGLHGGDSPARAGARL